MDDESKAKENLGERKIKENMRGKEERIRIGEETMEDKRKEE